MYDIKLMEHILTELNKTISGSPIDYVGGIFGWEDDTGVFKVETINGYQIDTSDTFVLNFVDTDNETEAIADTFIVNYQFLINVLIPVEHVGTFSQSITDFRTANNAKATTVNDVNTFFKIDLSNKEADPINTGGRTYIEYSFEITTLGAPGLNFGNETKFEIRERLNSGVVVYYEYETTDLNGNLITKYQYDLNAPEDGFAYGTATLAADTEDATDTITLDTDKIITTYLPITNLIVRDDFAGLSIRALQRQGESITTHLESGEIWGTAITAIADFTDIFHRSIIEQIANVSKKAYTLKITLPTFSPYYKTIILDNVSQASPLGGLITLSATVKEID